MCDPNWNWKRVVDDLALVSKCQLCGYTGHSARRCPDFTYTQVLKRRRMVNLSLPEVLIQRIQSFMSGKEAAQTSILSKSWYTAWLTRPNLEFRELDFRTKNTFLNREDHDFWGFATNTLRRYQELNLKIESFSLYILENSMNYLAEELIVKAMKMGAVDFDFGFQYLSGLTRSSTLPHVVLEFETLIRLSLNMIKLVMGENSKISWSRLGSLNLRYVNFGDDNIISNIISSCPLIEELTLFRCRGTQDRWIRLDVDGPCNLSPLYKLKSLFLFEADVDPLFFSEVLSNFSCLKVLSLHNCGGFNYKGIKLSSCSLECVTFKQGRLLRANFDIPSIRKFEYSGQEWPSVSFTTPSRNWESRINVRCGSRSTTWFLKLHELLTRLSLSKISLSLKIQSLVEKPVGFQGLPKPAVENLTIHECPSASPPGIECLFQVCRPKVITLCLLNGLCGWKSSFLEMLWKKFVQEGKENCSTENNNMYDLHDLEEVNVPLFEESVAEWRPVSCLKTLLGAPIAGDSRLRREDLPKIRFQLRWAVNPISLK